MPMLIGCCLVRLQSDGVSELGAPLQAPAVARSQLASLDLRGCKIGPDGRRLFDETLKDHDVIIRWI